MYAFVSSITAQVKDNKNSLPAYAIKTNALYWATTTPNLGFEIGLSDKFTLDLSGNYNPWTFSDSKKLKHWLVQPELRYWTCERFNGHFFGLHAHYAEYNVGGIKMLGLKDRLSIEATIGVGYAYLDYDKYPCGKCGTKLKDGHKNYFGPTKAGVSLIYILK